MHLENKSDVFPELQALSGAKRYLTPGFNGAFLCSNRLRIGVLRPESGLPTSLRIKPT